MNTTTRASGLAVSVWVVGSPGSAASRNRPVHVASTRPTIAPAPARRRLSMRCWRAMRPRPAPSASRTAISFCREVDRASSRLATFAHAMSSTTPTMHMRTTSGVENCCAHVREAARSRENLEMLAHETLTERVGDIRERLNLLLVDLFVDDIELNFGGIGA